MKKPFGLKHGREELVASFSFLCRYLFEASLFDGRKQILVKVFRQKILGKSCWTRTLGEIIKEV